MLVLTSGAERHTLGTFLALAGRGSRTAIGAWDGRFAAVWRISAGTLAWSICLARLTRHPPILARDQLKSSCHPWEQVTDPNWDDCGMWFS